MSSLYIFIATQTTNERVIPTAQMSQPAFNRQVALAFQDITGGTTTVGDLKLRISSASIPGHLLCDGSTITREAFPQLVTYLTGSETEASAELPNFVGGTLTPAATAPEQTTEGGTVSTGGTVTSPSQPGEVGGSIGGNIPSRGRTVEN